MQINLPWPPSNNVYYRHNRGRTHISAEGKAYREYVELLIYALKANQFGKLPVAVSIVANPPDRRRRDLDNLVKGVFDSLTNAGMWDDDSQVHDLHLRWGEVVKGGGLVVTINEIGEVK
jgi:crossover junction endodeoxyribonuclease RusA